MCAFFFFVWGWGGVEGGLKSREQETKSLGGTCSGGPRLKEFNGTTEVEFPAK